MLDVTIEDQPNAAFEDRSFGIKGLRIQGAVCQNNKLLLTSAITSELPFTRLRWTHAQQQTAASSGGKVTLPVYLNATRTEILFTVDLAMARVQEELSFYERGVAILASTTLN